MSLPKALALAWPPSNVHGWGVFGSNLVKELQKRGSPAPVLFAPTDPTHLDPEDRAAFKPLIEQQQSIEQQTAGQPGTLTSAGVGVIHGLGNNLSASEINARFRGEPNIGFTFFEQVDFPDNLTEQCRWLDIVMAGSSWNAAVLRDLGFPKVGCAFQGVNTQRFQPQPRSARFGDKFVVFSGGKLELRKGQDIVLEAFKRFHNEQPDSLLVSVWMNPWPHIVGQMAPSPYIEALPKFTGNWVQDIPTWSARNGLPEGAHLDMGPVANQDMPSVLAGCDCALFPNRCEGGTNLVAMEAMAAGLPCILSANSGHMDLIQDDNCLALTRQSPVTFAPPGSDHWRESEIDEIVAALHRLYEDHAERRRIGEKGAQFMKDCDWANQIDHLLREIDRLND